MDPVLVKPTFGICIILLILAILPLPFLEVGSREFIADMIGLIVTSLLLLLVIWDIRRQTRHQTTVDRSKVSILKSIKMASY